MEYNINGGMLCVFCRPRTKRKTENHGDSNVWSTPGGWKKELMMILVLNETIDQLAM